MISVDEAAARIAGAFKLSEAEEIALEQAAGRVLAQDVRAVLSQPPAAVSSMDGYAVRAADCVAPGTRLRIIGAAPAGHPFAGRLGPGETVRIFTGAVVPEGADAIVIQEDADTQGETVTFHAPAALNRHIRDAGIDFKAGEVLAKAGRRLGACDLALLAAGDIAKVSVRRRPCIAFAATGDELSRPGEKRKAGGIVASSGYGLAALIERWGACPRDLGILPDTARAVAGIADAATGADLIVTLGGASVGEHDLIQNALGPRGFKLDFWKIAMRPGKPLIFGRLGETPLLGLPGNPVSSLVCAILFLRPAIAAMLGTDASLPLLSAQLIKGLPANDTRQDYLRACLSLREGEYWAEAFAVQDSSMLSTLARADALILRAPHAPAAKAGERVDVIALANI